MEFFAFVALFILTWLSWQLVKAKRFTRFKQKIDAELKNKVIANIKEEMIFTRCEGLPNNDNHQAATIFYWTQYKSRILHAALSREIISQEWLLNSGNLRNAQHLFFIERAYLPTKSSLIKSTD
jgi:hypothetical protein